MDNRLPARLLATASKSRFSMGRPLAATVVLKMKSTASALFLGIAVVGLTISPSANAVPIVYDLAADWSDISNPNGVWSYLVNGAIAASGTRTGDTFGTPQPIWGAGFTGWSQSNGTEGSPTTGQWGTCSATPPPIWQHCHRVDQPRRRDGQYYWRDLGRSRHRSQQCLVADQERPSADRWQYSVRRRIRQFESLRFLDRKRGKFGRDRDQREHRGHFQARGQRDPS